MYATFGLSENSLKAHFLLGHANSLQQAKTSPAMSGLSALASPLENYYNNTRYPSDIAIPADLAVKSFTKDLHQVNILIWMDNMITMANINHLGGTHSPLLNNLATVLWKWCLERHFFDSRAPARKPNCRRGIEESEGSMRLDATPRSVCKDSEGAGPSGGGPVCLSVDSPASSLHQLETRPGCRGNPLELLAATLYLN